MKTSIDFVGEERSPKLTYLKVNLFDEKLQKNKLIGEVIIDLSKYIDWTEKATENLELDNGKAKIEFQIKSIQTKDNKR